MNQKIRRHIFISGRVQKVFFRYSGKLKANQLGVFGWIKNLPDGRVESVFEGDMDKVEKFIEWAKRGSFFSKVENIEIKSEKYKGEFAGFEIRR